MLNKRFNKHPDRPGWLNQCLGENERDANVGIKLRIKTESDKAESPGCPRAAEKNKRTDSIYPGLTIEREIPGAVWEVWRKEEPKR